MIVLYNNKVWDSILTYSSQNVNYDWTTALWDTRLSRYGRSAGCTSEYIQFSFTATVDVSYVAILAYNLTENATVTFSGTDTNTSGGWTSPTFSETITILNTYDDLQPSTKYPTVIKKLSAKRSNQYYRITIADSGNTDGFIQIGYIFLGEELTYPSLSIGAAMPRKSNALVNESTSGQTYGQQKTRWKEIDTYFESVERTNKDLIDEFFDIVDIVRPFVLCIWEDSLSVEPPVYCRFVQEPNWSREPMNGDLWKVEQKFKEVF